MSAYRTKSTASWEMPRPNTLNKNNNPGDHINSTTYYHAQLFRVEGGGEEVQRVLMDDSVGNVQGTRWSEIINKPETFFSKTRQGSGKSYWDGKFSSGWKGESWDKIMERLETLLEAIGVEHDLYSTDRHDDGEKYRPKTYKPPLLRK